MKKFITGVVMCAISFQAVAESELEQKVKSIVVLKKYTETVACGTNFEDERPLEEFLKHTFTANEGHSYYIYGRETLAAQVDQARHLSTLVK